MTWAFGISFPIRDHQPAEGQPAVTSIPWGSIEMHRPHILERYGHSLEYLAAHGGLSINESSIVRNIVESRTNAAHTRGSDDDEDRS